ncbi:MAG TPA: ABC transporter substrate-binding protein [Thermoanaerobaculia bacterium]|nr:ABC transporter substrate-binding protein [Thermoanaerobaculia bacterium]
MGRRCLLLLSIALCFACARDERPAAPRTSSAAAISDDTPVDGGTLLRRLDVDVVSLNPVLPTSRYDRYVDQYLHTPLVYLDKNLQPIPGLAKSWTISDDGLVYRFELNPKATFSDGTPVRASDVVFTLRKIVDPATNAAQVKSSFEELDLARTRAIDETTVEIAFKKALATQLTRFIDVMPIPEHVYGKGDFRNDYNSVAVGSGPYRLVKRDVGKEVIVERRNDYWGEKPHIQRVVFRFIADHGTAWSALKLGNIDESILASDTWLRERTNPTLNRFIDFQRFYTLSYNYIAWNERVPLFSDKRIRRALSMCVPLEAVIQDLYHGTARAMNGPFTPDEYAYNPSVPVVRYDPDEAKRLFASAGWLDRNADGVLEKDGKNFAFNLMILPGSATTKQFAQMVQSELKKVGVQVEIGVMDSAQGIENIGAGNYQAAYLGWDLDPDPDPYALFHSTQAPPSGQNFVFYANREADAVMEEARRTLDASKRKALYWRLHEILAEDQPYTWTIQPSLKWGINKRVRGVAISPGYGLFLWYPGELGWWIAPPAKQ